ncbi:MAG TPA: DUF447 domain-containing protein [Candidatus Polarisedimenticolia bacterium]|nr:DUF447 domain-containing protein [Candidatus Polarisedimenticolia bacterium]
MILETIVSTLDASSRPNFAPMGISLEEDRVLLRPFRGTQTWKNLDEVGAGVVHFTDDVLLFARCALSAPLPPHRPAETVRGVILLDTCHWKEFSIESRDLSGERGRFLGRVVAAGRARDFAGLNRAKHAVIEATILATRLHLLGRARVLEEMARLRPLLDKTGGAEEREAFAFIGDYVRDWAAPAEVSDAR